MTDANKKTALVTGATKGIGLEIARQLGHAGMLVYLGCRNQKRGEEAARVLNGEGLTVRAAVLDVTNIDTITALAKRIEQEQGHLDVLVNNAGVTSGKMQPPSETPLDDVRKVYETNVFGVISMIHAFLPLLRKAEAGRIVNVSSSLGSLAIHSDPNGPYREFTILDYNSSKTALNAVTQEFANELRGTTIKVNAVCPGYVATDLNNHSGPRTTEQGAKIAVKMALLDAAGPTGGFFDDNGVVPW